MLPLAQVQLLIAHPLGMPLIQRDTQATAQELQLAQALPQALPQRVVVTILEQAIVLAELPMHLNAVPERDAVLKAPHAVALPHQLLHQLRHRLRHL